MTAIEKVGGVDYITEQQARLYPAPPTFWERWARARSRDRRRPVHERRELRRRARWWDLEAMRGYASADRSREYAANMRWLVELMDNGVQVVGRRFDENVREQGARR